MDYITSITFGFFTAFLGLLTPSMLNMTAAKMSIDRGRKSGVLFALGASSTVIIQVGIAVFFAKYLIKHPEIILNLKTVAVFVLLALAIFFFIQAKKEQNIEGKNKKGHPYFIGLGMSSLNMLAIPFYLTMATLAENKEWFQLKIPYSITYILGTTLGVFCLFSLYAIFAIKITKKAKFITKNMNYILSGLFVILAIITLIKLLN